jgi:phosphatidylinositol alpha 1,6-mannosyltransferase
MQTILFIVTGFPPDVSGVSLFNWERAVWLSQQDSYRIVVMAPDWQSTNDHHYPEIPVNSNLVVDTYPSKPWLPYKLTHVPKYSAASFIEERITFHQPDLIVVTDAERLFLLSTWRLPGKTYARQQGIPFIAEYHTDLYNFSAAYPGWQWLRSIVRVTKLTSYLYRQFDLTLCTSQAAELSCLEMGIENVQSVPFLGVDTTSYSPNLRNRYVLQSWLPANEMDNTILLFLGRLGYEKRVDLLIEAFQHLSQKNNRFSLLIVGDGPTEVVTKLQAQAASCKNIHFAGFLLGEQKAKVLAACDIFCSPSPYETFGRTIVEAMASGLVVVTVASGAVAEYIQQGVNGYLVPAEDANALAEMIQQIATQPQVLVTQQALAGAQQFSIEQGCQQLADFYQELIQSHSSSLTSIDSHDRIPTPQGS